MLEQEELDRHKLDRKLAAEADWLRYGVTARRKRNVRRLGNLHAMRQERREQRGALGTVNMTHRRKRAIRDAGRRSRERSPRPIGERALVSDLSLRILRGDRLGIVGPNGAGKTTLINLLTGVTPAG